MTSIRHALKRKCIISSVAICAALSAGCSSSDSAKQAQGDSNAAPASATAVAASNDADFPVYPNATKDAVPGAMGQQTICGRKMTIKMYDVGAADKTVLTWYQSHLPNMVLADLAAANGDDSNSSAAQSSAELLSPDGGSAVMVMQMHFTSGSLQAASKTIGMDKTTIGFERFDPPLGSDYVHFVAQATAGDGAAKAAARAKLTAMCPSP